MLRNNQNINDSQMDSDLEFYQKRMTWVVSAEDISESELHKALKQKLQIDKDSKLLDHIIIQEARKVQEWQKNNGNVAYAKFTYKFPENIVHKGYIIAIEGKQFMPGTAIIEMKDGKKDIIIDPISPISNLFKVQNVAEEKEWYHAIRKLIITMADLWELDKLLYGEVLIVSEGTICKSCREIIHKFEKEYPNISKVLIRDNASG